MHLIVYFFMKVFEEENNNLFSKYKCRSKIWKLSVRKILPVFRVYENKCWWFVRGQGGTFIYSCSRKQLLNSDFLFILLKTFSIWVSAIESTSRNTCMTVAVQVRVVKQKDFLNWIIHLPFLALSIIIFRDYQDENWKLVSQQS